MKAEIVSVGTEMLLGMIVDTNAQYLTQQLADLGVDVFWISQVGDNLGRVVDTFQRGMERSDLIVVTGGLGPTEDDLTRESIAAALGETITVDPDLERWLRDNFARRNRAMPERNIKQATLIPSARPLANPVGTAPGWWVEKDGTIIVAMPGVPTEMRLMWTERACPLLRERVAVGVLVTTSLRILGVGEAAVEEDLGELIHGTNPTVATYAKPDGVQVRLSAKAADEATARAILGPVAEQVAGIFGSNVFGRDDETISGLAGALLAARGWTIASAERGTAGALAGEISLDASLSGRYLGGFVLNAHGDPLGVDSDDPADLAKAARAQTGGDVAVATVLRTVDGRPAGTYAVDTGTIVRGDTARWNLAIPELRRRAAFEALALLVKTLREEQ